MQGRADPAASCTPVMAQPYTTAGVRRSSHSLRHSRCRPVVWRTPLHRYSAAVPTVPCSPLLAQPSGYGGCRLLHVGHLLRLLRSQLPSPPHGSWRCAPATGTSHLITTEEGWSTSSCAQIYVAACYCTVTQQSPLPPEPTPSTSAAAVLLDCSCCP